MSINFKKSYKFAIKSSFYITLFATGLVAILLYLFFEINYQFIGLFGLATLSFSFFVLFPVTDIDNFVTLSTDEYQIKFTGQESDKNKTQNSNRNEIRRESEMAKELK